MGKWRYRGDDDGDDEVRIDKMRKSRKDKKQTTHDASFEKPETEWPLEEGELFAARVVEVQKRYAFVNPEPKLGDIKTRDVRLATVARKFLTSKREERNLIAVGDRVLCRPAGQQDEDVNTDIPRCVIEHMAPRTSKIARVDPATPDREHILACNIDQLMIVASFLHPPVRWGLIDRYLVLAEEQGLPAFIVLTKSDLLKTEADQEFRAACERERKTLEDLGYPVYVTSPLYDGKKSAVFTQLKERLKGKITLLSGHSGVGKSSLVNLFRPEIEQEVEPDADIFYKGRHTTTYASLIRLGTGGGFAVDTPGIRSFLLPPQDAMSLSHCFVEFRPFMGTCRYGKCRHLGEPECGIKDAVEKGAISPRRYRSYVGMLVGETGREGRTRDEE